MYVTVKRNRMMRKSHYFDDHPLADPYESFKGSLVWGNKFTKARENGTIKQHQIGYLADNIDSFQSRLHTFVEAVKDVLTDFEAASAAGDYAKATSALKKASMALYRIQLPWETGGKTMIDHITRTGKECSDVLD